MSNIDIFLISFAAVLGFSGVALDLYHRIKRA